jgi:hypothetical protein
MIEPFYLQTIFVAKRPWPSLLPQIQELEGRFAGLLPPKEPTEEMALAARNLLQAMGVTIEQVGPDPRWN